MEDSKKKMASTRHNRTNPHRNSETVTVTGSNQPKSSTEKGKETKVPPPTKGCLQSTADGKGKTMSLPWSEAGHNNHTPGQGLCPGVVGQPKTDCNIFCVLYFVMFWNVLSLGFTVCLFSYF